MMFGICNIRVIHVCYLKYYSNLDTLCIASDSPTSQYQHKKMIFLVNNKTHVYCIFRQAGHGKGPMDGLGACIK